MALRSSKSTVALLTPDHDAFSVIAANLRYLRINRPLRSVVVTGVRSRQSTAWFTMQLAASLGSSGQRVVVVDANLRQPALHLHYHLDNTCGLTDLMLQQAQVGSYLQKVAQSSLGFLGTGPVPPNPADFLASPAMKSVLAELAALADLVLLDAAPVTAGSDALGLVAHGDGVLLVVDAGVVRCNATRACIERVRQSGGYVLGAVLNRAGGGMMSGNSLV